MAESRLIPKPSLTRRFTRPGRSYKVATALVSLFLGILIWSYINSRRVEVNVFQVRLGVQIPEGWEIEGTRPPQTVPVRLRGPRQLISSLKADELSISRAIKIPANWRQAAYPTTLILASGDVRGLPPEVMVTLDSPRKWELRLVRLVEKYVNVKVEVIGKPQPGYEISFTEADPMAVRVRLPESLYNPSLEVKTEPVDIAKARLVIDRYILNQYVGLQPLQLKDRAIRLKKWVYVTVQIVEKTARRKFEKVPVRVLLATPGENLKHWKLDPPQVEVTVEGRPDRLKELKPASVTVFVDTRDMGSSAEGEYSLKCHSLAPEWLRVVKISPEEIKWLVLKPASKGKP